MAQVDNKLTELYNTEWYNNGTESYKSAKEALRVILDLVPYLQDQTTSVIDVGCGIGTWLKAWQELCDNIYVFGIDGNNVEADHFFIEHNNYQQVDLTMCANNIIAQILQHKNVNNIIGRNMGGGGELRKVFSIAQSLEVAEHLHAKHAQNFIHLLVSLSDIVLFSAAIPHQGGTHHVNEQPPMYWADFFTNYGYVCFDIIRPMIWNNTQISWWYRQNMFLYVHKDKANIFETLGFSSTKNPSHLIIPSAYENKISIYENQIKMLNNKINKTFFRRLNKLSKRIRGKL